MSIKKVSHLRNKNQVEFKMVALNGILWLFNYMLDL